MNREQDTVFLQTLGRFIQVQIQLAVAPLIQTINDQANTIAQLSVDKNSIIKELDGAIEGFAAEIARVESVVNGIENKEGKVGPAGRDGADVVAAFRDSDGHLILTLSNGITKDVGLIHGRDGKDGLPGKDGLGFKDMSAVWDGERTLTFKFVMEDRVEEMQISIPFPLFRGIWKRGNEYTQGDSVGYEGSTWICLRNTDKQPGTNDSGWVLSTKRGLDGKSGEQGKQGLPGKDGERGRDLTQIGFDGKKW